MMHLRKLACLIAVMFMASACSSASMASLHNKLMGGDKHDPISGEWEVAFTLQGTTVMGTFTLKLDGDKVTGTAVSEHTGSGTVTKGTWSDHKISFTLDFSKHDSIAITGRLKDGHLSGEFKTEGMEGTWEAKKK
jgi:hypothetical protein